MDDNTRKLLKIYSYLFFFLAAWDILLLIINYVADRADIQDMVTSGQVGQALANGSMIGLTVITVVFAVLKLLVGYKGLRLIKGEGGTKGLVPILKILLIFELIGLAALIVSAFSGSYDSSQIANSVVSVFILFDFLRNVKLFKSET